MKLGDMVIYKQGNGEFHYNNTRFHPAVITKVNDDGTYNIHAFIDSQGAQPQVCVSAGSVDDDVPCVMSNHEYENQTSSPIPATGNGD